MGASPENRRKVRQPLQIDTIILRLQTLANPPLSLVSTSVNRTAVVLFMFLPAVGASFAAGCPSLARFCFMRSKT
jgi:hypothetical protein